MEIPEIRKELSSLNGPERDEQQEIDDEDDDDNLDEDDIVEDTADVDAESEPEADDVMGEMEQMSLDKRYSIETIGCTYCFYIQPMWLSDVSFVLSYVLGNRGALVLFPSSNRHWLSTDFNFSSSAAADAAVAEKPKKKKTKKVKAKLGKKH
jgi:hypothetical protein